MTKSILKLSLLGLLAIAVVGRPVQLHAQTDTPAPEKKARTVMPFHGKLKAVDSTAKTISIGERTFQITSDTKIFKGEKPATLADAVVGENAGGSYKKTQDGKLDVLMVHFGPKPEGDTAAKPKKAAKKEEPKM
jgi:hypothetical protein